MKNDCSNLLKIRRNAMMAAHRDGYDQLVVQENDGSYTIVRKGLLDKNDDRKLIGRVFLEYCGGCRLAKFQLA